MLIAAGLAIYEQTLNYGFITFDDPGYVYENPHVTHGLTWSSVGWAFTSLEQSNWHPLTWISLQADAQLYGLHASGYHLTNLLLHLANACLLFLWLRSATGVLWPPALTAFFFVVHPMHVESVAWITERKDVLSTLFFYLTLLAYTRYVQRRGIASYLLALVFYVLGLLAKPMLVSLPALLLLLDYWPLARWANCSATVPVAGHSASPATGTVALQPDFPWRFLADKLPFVFLAGLSCVVTLIVQHHGSAVVPLVNLPISYRIGSASLGYMTYLAKTFYPVDLGIYYPFWRGESYGLSMLCALLLIAVLIVTLLYRRRMPWLAVGWGWYLLTLLPVIGLVQVGGQAVADRYTYLPHTGLFLMIFWTAADIWRRTPASRPPLLAALGVASAACLALSIRQAWYWRSSAALFQRTLEVAAPSGRLYHLLGDALLEANQSDDAGVAYRKAIALQPTEKDVALQLGVIDLRQQRWAEAHVLFARLAANPDAAARVFNNDALALARLGRTGEATQMYGRALAKDPRYALAHFGLADLLCSTGDTPGAAAEYERGLALRDDWIPALCRLAWIDAQSADPQLRAAALPLAQRAVDLSHGGDLGSLDALAVAQASSGNWTAAVAAATAAFKLAGAPGSPPEASAISRQRLDLYRKNQMPDR